MVAKQSQPKLLAIVGPTATGKTELAINIAKQFNGEIIAADSRTIYKDMDIGTAKPSKADQKEVAHWGLDLVEPGQAFSAAQFQKYASDKIKQIQSRDKLPILVGGTGLYIDGVVFDFKFRPKADAKLRQKLEKLSIKELQDLIEEKGYPMPENRQNRRHLVRTIETAGQVGHRNQRPKSGTLVIGLMPPSNELKQRIEQRLNRNFDLITKETRNLLTKYGRAAVAKTAGIPYLAAIDYLDGKIGKTEAKERIAAEEWQYARRQRTWFRRNPYLHWFNSAEKAFTVFKSGRIR